MILPHGLTLPLLIGAALVDSINPCVFGVLIFLIGFMLKTFKSPHRMLLGGIWYTIVVYVTYFAIGIGFLKVTTSLGVSVIIYWIAAIISLAAGLLEIKDFFWYGKWFSLQLIPGAAERLKMYTKKIEDLERRDGWFTFVLAGLLGVFVVMIELPCTGAPYLAVLAILSEGNYTEGIPLLLLYNFIFILPLLFIIGLAYFGKSSKILEAWRHEHRGLMRLFMGLFLVALGAYMIYKIT